MAELTDAHREEAEELLPWIPVDDDALLYHRQRIAQAIADAETRGRTGVLAELVDLLRDARCGYRDPGLRMTWARKRKALLNEAIDAAHADTPPEVSPT